MRLFQSIKKKTASLITVCVSYVFSGIVLFNKTKDYITDYITGVPSVKQAKEVTQILLDSDEAKELTEGMTLIPNYLIECFAGSNVNIKKAIEAKQAEQELKTQRELTKRIIKNIFIMNAALAAKAFVYYQCLRIVSMFSGEEWPKAQAFVMWTLGLEAAGVAIQMAVHIASLNKLAEKRIHMYQSGKDTTAISQAKANLASGVYYISYKAALWAVSFTPYVGVVLSHGGMIFVDGQAHVEFRVMNQSTPDRYAILSQNNFFSLAVGFVIVMPAYFISQGIAAVTGVNSKIIEFAIQNILMPLNLLAMIQREQPLPGKNPHPEIMQVPREITAMMMKKGCSFMVNCMLGTPRPAQEFKLMNASAQNNLVRADNQETLQEENVDTVEFKMASRAPSQKEIDLFATTTCVLVKESEIKRLNKETIWTLFCYQNKKILYQQNDNMIDNLSDALAILPANVVPESLSSKQVTEIKEIIFSNHSAQLDKIFYKELSDVVSGVAKFFLGKKFSTIDNVVHIESISILLELCQNSIDEGLAAVQRVQNSHLPQYLLRFWERLPKSVSEYFLPADCKPEYVKFLARAVGANLVRELVNHLGTVTGIQPEQETAPSLVEGHVLAPPPPIKMSLATIDENAMQGGDVFRPTGQQNSAASPEEKKSESEAPQRKLLIPQQDDYFAASKQPASSSVRRRNVPQPPASPRDIGVFARSASGVVKAVYEGLSTTNKTIPIKKRTGTSFNHL